MSTFKKIFGKYREDTKLFLLTLYTGMRIFRRVY